MSKRVLIVRTDRVGDVILSTPAIKAVRDFYPDSYIAVLVRPYARGAVEGNPYINEVITYDKSGSEKTFGGKLRFISDIRKKRFDMAIILHPKNSVHICAFLAGIPERVGYGRKMGMLLTKRIPHTKQYGLKHEIDYILDVLRYAGIEARGRDLYMPVDGSSEERIKEIFGKNGISQNDLVITIHPAASCRSKRWQAQRFAKTADILAERYGAKIVIIAGPKDRAFGDKAAESMKAWHLNLSGKTSVPDIAGVLRRSKLLISNDSGPVHIACAVGTPVISIFGRRDRGLSPRRWGPAGKRDIVLHRDVGCDICLAHNCKAGFKCLDAISVEDVVSAADKILKI